MNKRSRQRGEGIKLTGIAIHEDLLEVIGHMAKDDGRSRNNMIVKMLTDQVRAYKASGKGPADDVCDAPGHCREITRLAADARAIYTTKRHK